MTENEAMRLTTDKKVTEMGMYELAHNCCYIKDGLARYRDFSQDWDARELARSLLKHYAESDDAFTCDDDFDECMLEYLQYGKYDIEGFIALFYRNLWAMADIRELLKDYEAIGTIDEFKALKEKMEELHKIVMCEQQSTSCEYTKLKSFEMIENILCET